MDETTHIAGEETLRGMCNPVVFSRALQVSGGSDLLVYSRYCSKASFGMDGVRTLVGEVFNACSSS